MSDARIPRSVWTADDGRSCVGYSDDVVQMLDDLGIPRETATPPRWCVDWKRGVGHPNSGLTGEMKK